jgi:hypothetical protein
MTIMRRAIIGKVASLPHGRLGSDLLEEDRFGA